MTTGVVRWNGLRELSVGHRVDSQATQGFRSLSNELPMERAMGIELSGEQRRRRQVAATLRMMSVPLQSPAFPK